MTRPTNWYVLCTGPYDQVFVGPFGSKEGADLFATDQEKVKPHFGFMPMSRNEFMANCLQFGPIQVTEPWRFVQ